MDATYKKSYELGDSPLTFRNELGLSLDAQNWSEAIEALLKYSIRIFRDFRDGFIEESRLNSEITHVIDTVDYILVDPSFISDKDLRRLYDLIDFRTNGYYDEVRALESAIIKRSETIRDEIDEIYKSRWETIKA